jgi:hypothetical protein
MKWKTWEERMKMRQTDLGRTGGSEARVRNSQVKTRWNRMKKKRQHEKRKWDSKYYNRLQTRFRTLFISLCSRELMRRSGMKMTPRTSSSTIICNDEKEFGRCCTTVGDTPFTGRKVSLLSFVQPIYVCCRVCQLLSNRSGYFECPIRSTFSWNFSMWSNDLWELQAQYSASDSCNCIFLGKDQGSHKMSLVGWGSPGRVWSTKEKASKLLTSTPLLFFFNMS